MEYSLRNSRIVQYNSGIGGQSRNSHNAQVQFRNCTILTLRWTYTLSISYKRYPYYLLGRNLREQLQKLNKLCLTFLQAYCNIWAHERLLNVVEQLIGPDIAGNPVWNLRTKTPQNDNTTVPWHQGNFIVQKNLCKTATQKSTKQRSKWQMVAEWRSKVLQNAPLWAFCNTFDLHSAIIGLENHFWSFWEWLVYTGFTVHLPVSIFSRNCASTR